MPVVSDQRALPRATASERWILGCVLNYEDRRPAIFTRLDESDFFEPSASAHPVYPLQLKLEQSSSLIGRPR
jgi:hypothetical protein